MVANEAQPRALQPQQEAILASLMPRTAMPSRLVGAARESRGPTEWDAQGQPNQIPGRVPGEAAGT